jgi:hypothetical protein
MKTKSAYSKNELAWLRKEAMKVKGATHVAHMYPRAYCVAKPAPCCAVFVTPWMDAEPQVLSLSCASSNTVSEGVVDVRVGDWCALAYVCTTGAQQMYAFKIPSPVGKG